MTPTSTRTATRALHLAAIGGLLLALTACAPDPNGPAVSGPALGDPGPAGPAAGDACERAFPGSPFGTDLADAPTVPADWTHPDGVELCGVYQSSDANAVLQYVTELEPDAVLDAWEPLLGGYTLERSSGMGSWPILNAVAGDLEFAIQTDGDTGAIVIGFAEGAA